MIYDNIRNNVVSLTNYYAGSWWRLLDTKHILRCWIRDVLSIWGFQVIYDIIRKPWSWIIVCFEPGVPLHVVFHKQPALIWAPTVRLFWSTWHEADFMTNWNKLSRSIYFTYRYIDDVLSPNNSKLGIFSIELEIKVTTGTCLLHIPWNWQGGRERNITIKTWFQFPTIAI